MPAVMDTTLTALADRVLIVDDSLVQRQHAVALCRSLGVHQVHEACDGQDALRRLAGLSEPPTLIVIDLEMPVMDGFELIQQLGRHGVQSPFVVASSREGALMRAVEAMAASLSLRLLAGVAKPLTREAMVAALQASHQSVVGQPKAALPARPTPIAPEALAEAVAQGRVTPQFQPKVDVRTGLLRGVEALARWTDPVLGAVPPDRFIATAEQHGLIGELTQSMMDQSLAQLSRWGQRGLNPSLAINLSPLSLQTPGLVEQITTLLVRHGVAPSQVVLEITESAAVSSDAASLSVLARLRMRGLGLSIDDYGTGFSSMQQLSRVPCTELKIDRSFVHGAHRSAHLQTLLQSALEMSNRLGLVSVAEGVETLEDWRLLQQLGCSVAQGYLLGRPMVGDALPRWLKEREPQLAALRRPD